jgi:uncharacterized DUF497 family protein
MKYFDWNEEKNETLKKTRNISFEVIVIQIEMGSLLDILEHPNIQKYKNQKIFVVEYENYVYLVPFIEEEDKIFLKTIIPSRKATKQYLED